MKKNVNTLLFPAIILALITLACGGGAAVTATVPAATPQSPTQPVIQSSGELEITSTNSYVDNFNNYTIAGEIVNNTNEAVENVILSLSIADEAGVSVLKDDNGNPLDEIEIQPALNVLKPGQSSPFTYYISDDEVKPATFEISIKSYDPSSATEALQVSIENVNSSELDGGDIVISGEVVNQTAKYVDVESLAGAILDETDNVLAVSTTLTYSRFLSPSGDLDGLDRGAFIVRIYGPIEGAAQWKIYPRAVENLLPPTADMDIQVAGSYVDTYGTYHLLGTVTNTGSDQISPAVIGGLFNSEKTVFDAASMNIPLYLKPGESAPFDLSTLQVVDSETAAQAASDATVKPDLYWVFTTTYELVSLESGGIEVIYDGYDWVVNGKVVNTSGKPLSNITAVIYFLDENQHVKATNYASIYPADGSSAIEPGASSDFSMYIYTPEGWDLNAQDYQIVLQGVVVE